VNACYLGKECDRFPHSYCDQSCAARCWLVLRVRGDDGTDLRSQLATGAPRRART
jgi:hypothetical protein